MVHTCNLHDFPKADKVATRDLYNFLKVDMALIRRFLGS